MYITFFALISRSTLPQYSVRIMLGGIVALALALACATSLHKRYHFTKKSFFSLITSLVFAVTLALVLVHSALISGSSEGGIVQRTGQLSLYACGQTLHISPTSRLSNAAGSGSYTVHPDGTMRFLGYTSTSGNEASLGSFFQSIGGSVSANVVTIPFPDSTKIPASLAQFSKLNSQRESYLELRSGESCTISPSMVSIHIYKYDAASKTYIAQKIIQHPERYVLSNQRVDARDCIVISYGDPKDVTRLTCSDYPNISQISNSTKELSL